MPLSDYININLARIGHDTWRIVRWPLLAGAVFALSYGSCAVQRSRDGVELRARDTTIQEQKTKLATQKSEIERLTQVNANALNLDSFCQFGLEDFRPYGKKACVFYTKKNGKPSGNFYELEADKNGKLISVHTLSVEYQARK